MPGSSEADMLIVAVNVWSELLDEPSLLLHHLVINQLEGLG